MAEKKILTKESLAKLQEELDDLLVNKRKEIAGKIKEAREQGDLSENAEYDAAKDEQRDIEARIEEIQELIKNSDVLDERKIDFNKIHVGCTAKVRDQATRKEITFQIVVGTEVNSRERKISYESPIGSALMDKEVGDVVEINTPAGKIRYKIVSIENPSSAGQVKKSSAKSAKTEKTEKQAAAKTETKRTAEPKKETKKVKEEKAKPEKKAAVKEEKPAPEKIAEVKEEKAEPAKKAAKAKKSTTAKAILITRASASKAEATKKATAAKKLAKK